MTWFWIALIGPALYAFANHTDKYLISRYFKGGEVGALIIFSGIFSVVALPVIYWLAPTTLAVTPVRALILAVNGSLTVISVLLYLYALRQDEASVVVPFYQTIPIFGFGLSYFILGEKLSVWQLVGSAVIIIGAFILSIRLEENGGLRFRGRVVGLMLAASLLYAVNGVIFKLLALDSGFWQPAFWTFLGKAAIGVLLFLLIASYRRQFLAVLKLNRGFVLGLNSGNEVATIIADGVTYYASLLAPVALVLTVNGFQPVFVFIYGVLLTLFLPRIAQERLVGPLLAQKILAIALVFAGSVMIGFA